MPVLDTPAIFDSTLVRLRAIEPDDWAVFAAQERDHLAMRAGAGWVPIPWSEHRLRTWAAEPERSLSKDDVFTWAIADPKTNEANGSINSHHCDRRVGVFSYGVMVFPAHRREGLASQAISLVLGFFFGELRYQKANVGIYAYNEASLALHRRLGFVEEGRLRRNIYTAGAYHDEILMGMTAEEYATELPR